MLTIIILLLALISAPAVALAHFGGDYYFHHMMNGWGWDVGMHWASPVTVILFWVLIIVAIIALVKWINKNK